MKIKIRRLLRMYFEMVEMASVSEGVTAGGLIVGVVLSPVLVPAYLLFHIISLIWSYIMLPPLQKAADFLNDHRGEGEYDNLGEGFVTSEVWRHPAGVVSVKPDIVTDTTIGRVSGPEQTA